MEKSRQRVQTIKNKWLIHQKVSMTRRVIEAILTGVLWGMIGAFLLFLLQSWTIIYQKHPLIEKWKIEEFYAKVSVYGIITFLLVLLNMFLFYILYRVLHYTFRFHSMRPNRIKAKHKAPRILIIEKSDYFILPIKSVIDRQQKRWVNIKPEEVIYHERMKKIRKKERH